MSRRDRRAGAQRRTIDRRIVMDDARRAGKAFREKGRHHDRAFDVRRSYAGRSQRRRRDARQSGIGTRDKLTLEEAEAAARKGMEVVQKYPKCAVYAHLLGYDDDPREIPQAPAAAEHVRQWARFAGINDFETTAAGPLGLLGAAFLAACGVFGEEMRRAIKMPGAVPEH
jgi:hypothetical protein